MNTLLTNIINVFGLFEFDLDTLLSWTHLITAVAGAIVALIPTVIALIVAIKKKIAAINENIKNAADTQILSYAQELIKNAEVTFAAVDSVLKQEGTSAGSLKKETVITKLKAFSIDNGFEFDETYWSNKVDEIVALTKEVNAK